MRTVWLAIPLIVAPASLSAQALASRIDALRDGTVRMSFDARPGVCGDGDDGVWIDDTRHSAYDYDRQRRCMPGPIRVTITRADGRTVRVRTRVGAAESGAADVDLGHVAATDGARYLLDLARSLGGRSADATVSAAAMADAPNIWPDFERLALDRDAALETRKHAMFWLGQSNDPGAIEFFRNLLVR